MDLTEYCAFDVDFDGNKTWREALVYVNQGRDLLTLCLGWPVRIDWVYVQLVGRERSMPLYYPPNEPLTAAESESQSTHRNAVLNYLSPTLLTARTAATAPLPMPLSALLRRYFTKVASIEDALGLLHAQCRVEAMLPHHRYAALFGCIEELYEALNLPQRVKAKAEHKAQRNRVKESIEDSNVRLSQQDRYWLMNLIAVSRNDTSIPQKVSSILGLSGRVGEQILEACPNFVRLSTQGRGKVAHGASGSAPEQAKRIACEVTLNYAVRVAVISLLLDLAKRKAFQESASEREYFKRIKRHISTIS